MIPFRQNVKVELYLFVISVCLSVCLSVCMYVGMYDSLRAWPQTFLMTPNLKFLYHFLDFWKDIYFPKLYTEIYIAKVYICKYLG